jgi:hypothetical protein
LDKNLVCHLDQTKASALKFRNNVTKFVTDSIIIIIIIIIFIQLQLGRNPVAEVYNAYTANV